MIMEWKKATGPFASGHALHVGKWIVGGVHYDSGKPRDSLLHYKATCRLPGVRADLGNFETEEQARAKVERSVMYWFDKSQGVP